MPRATTARAHWSGTCRSPQSRTFWHEFTPEHELNHITLRQVHDLRLPEVGRWPRPPRTSTSLLVRSSDLGHRGRLGNDQNGGTLPPIEALCYTQRRHQPDVRDRDRKFSATTPRFDLFVGPRPSHIQSARAASWSRDRHPRYGGGRHLLADRCSRRSAAGARPSMDDEARHCRQDRTSSLPYGAASEGSGGFAGTSASHRTWPARPRWWRRRTPESRRHSSSRSLESMALDRGATGKDSLYGSGRLWLGSSPLVDPDGATFFPLTPARLLDSRFGNGLNGVFQRTCRAPSRSPAAEACRRRRPRSPAT